MSFFKTTKTIRRYGEEQEVSTLRTGRVIGASILGFLLVLTFFLCWTIIPTGYTGVRTTFGQIDAASVPAGFSWKIPYVQSIEKVNNKQQDIEFTDKIWSESSERTALYFEKVIVTYQIKGDKSAWIYANVSDYRRTLVSPEIVASALKTASKQLNSTDVTNRGMIEPLAQQTLQTALDAKYGNSVVNITKVVVSNMDFEDSYNEAIADKQKAQLAYEKQKIENQKSVEKAQAEADAKVKTAEGEAKASVTKANADAQVITTKADAQAKANKILAESVTDQLVRYNWIQKWNGAMPSTMLGSDTSTMINIPTP